MRKAVLDNAVGKISVAARGLKHSIQEYAEESSLADTIIMRNTRLQRFLLQDLDEQFRSRYKIDSIQFPADGDCFYWACGTALLSLFSNLLILQHQQLNHQKSFIASTSERFDPEESATSDILGESGNRILTARKYSVKRRQSSTPYRRQSRLSISGPSSLPSNVTSNTILSPFKTWSAKLSQMRTAHLQLKEAEFFLREEFSCENLRSIVADELTEEVYMTYRCYHEADIPGYTFMKSIENLDNLRQRLRLSRDKDQLSLNEVIWADAFAIQTLSNHFQVGFLIVNETLEDITTSVVRPDFTTRAGRERSRRNWALLHLSRRDHYSLLTVNGWRFFEPSIHPLPEFLAAKFNLTLHTDVR